MRKPQHVTLPLHALAATDAVLLALGQRCAAAETCADALALALARVCAASGLDVAERCELVRAVAAALREEPC